MLSADRTITSILKDDEIEGSYKIVLLQLQSSYRVFMVDDGQSRTNKTFVELG